MRKWLVALEEGYRESQESWASVLRDLRGVDRAFGPRTGVSEACPEGRLTFGFPSLPAST